MYYIIKQEEKKNNNTVRESITYQNLLGAQKKIENLLNFFYSYLSNIEKKKFIRIRACDILKKQILKFTND